MKGILKLGIMSFGLLAVMNSCGNDDTKASADNAATTPVEATNPESPPVAKTDGVVTTETEGAAAKASEAEMPKTTEGGAKVVKEADTKSSSKEAYSLDEFQKLINSNKIVIVDFKADWCGPCKKLAPILEKVNADSKDKIKLQKVDVDLSQEVAQMMKIDGIPYVVKYVDGKKVADLKGLVPEAQVRTFFAN